MISRTQHGGSIRHAAMRGFSLIEVMIAVIVIAVGMLGIAKMQALALSTTASSGTRSLVAIEAASLAASMHANRDYWVNGPPAPVIHVTTSTLGVNSTSVSIDVSTLAGTPSCGITSACTAATTSQIAAYDLQQWGAALAQVVPASVATITCNTSVPSSCTIQITWQENLTSTNNTTAAVSSAAGTLSLLRCRRGGRLDGYLILLREEVPSLGLSRSKIVDMLVAGDDADVVDALLAAAHDLAREQGSHILELVGFPREVRARAARSRPFSRMFPGTTYYYKAMPAGLAAELRFESAWYPTLYDGDSSV